MSSPSVQATYADYLATEQNSEKRHEFIDGVIVAMAGGSYEHSAIATRFTTLFGVRVASGCLSYNSDQRFWIAAAERGRYSDGSIICGRPARPAHDHQAATNPLVVVEVLSPSSEDNDDGDKRRDFQSLASSTTASSTHPGVRCSPEPPPGPRRERPSPTDPLGIALTAGHVLREIELIVGRPGPRHRTRAEQPP